LESGQRETASAGVREKERQANNHKQGYQKGKAMIKERALWNGPMAGKGVSTDGIYLLTDMRQPALSGPENEISRERVEYVPAKPRAQ
jgi:hypothetical protein